MKNIFYNKLGEVIPIEGLYKNQSCFLISSGPSLKTLNLELLNQPGIVTFGVNNSATVYRPNMWVSVDDPANFALSIWLDPLINKFVMLGKRDKKLWDNYKWEESKTRVQDCANITYYKDNEYFRIPEWFDEETINWGNHTDRCECGNMRGKDEKGRREKICKKCGGNKFGARSVMLAALKIIYTLGFNKAFIIGADFKMSDTQTYAFNQERTSHSINSNTDTYTRLNERFSLLRPEFEKRNFHVFNATPDSGLDSFVKIDFEDAIKICIKDFPDTKNERTFGMYERKACDKHVDENALKVCEVKSQMQKLGSNNPQLMKKLQRRLDKFQAKLDVAIIERDKILKWKA